MNTHSLGAAAFWQDFWLRLKILIVYRFMRSIGTTDKARSPVWKHFGGCFHWYQATSKNAMDRDPRIITVAMMDEPPRNIPHWDFNNGWRWIESPAPRQYDAATPFPVKTLR